MKYKVNEPFKAFISERYNKKNIVFFIIFSLIIGTIYILSGTSKAIEIIICLISCIFLYALVQGYYALTAHNEIHNNEEIFPSIKNLPKILVLGIKFTFGTLINTMIALIIPLILATISVTAFIVAYKSMPDNIITFFIISCILGIIAIAFFITVQILLLIPLTINYLTTLEFKSFFKLHNAIELRKERKGIYAAFIGNIILYSLIINLICIVFTFIICLAAKHYVLTLPKEEWSTYFSTIQGVLAMILQVLFIPNLIGELVHTKNEPIDNARVEQAEN
jgi:hypothetical protein